jgi:hypothetical protein
MTGGLSKGLSSMELVGSLVCAVSADLVIVTDMYFTYSFSPLPQFH